MNVQGLADKNKRRDTFNFIQSKHPSIIFLQDTHFIDTDESEIYSEIGMNCFFNNYSSQSRGVAIFINSLLDIKIISEYKDSNGNLLILNCIIFGKRITLVNLYGPNKDNPDFFKVILNKIKCSDSFTIMGGDFNLI